MPPSRSGSRAASVNARSPENWFYALDALLVRDRELDQLAPDRFAKNPDPEKAPFALSDRHDYRLATPLYKLFREYDCGEYTRALTESGFWPFDPSTEIEIRGLRAVIDWLRRVRRFPPYSTPEEQQEIRELRDILNCATQKRLRQLEPAAATNANLGRKPKATINMRMADEVLKNPEAMGWTTVQWQRCLKCRSRSTIADTATWKNLEIHRAGLKAARRKDRTRRPRHHGKK
jgi:hypothetical protein